MRTRRNPMYVGNMLILIGLAVASNSWTCVAVVIPVYAFVCAAIVAAEERYLRGVSARFRCVLSRRAAMVAAFERNLSHARGTQLQLAAGRAQGIRHAGRLDLAWGLLVFWNLTRSEGGTDAHRAAVAAVAGIMAAMLAFWVFARIAKKSRRLGKTA